MFIEIEPIQKILPWGTPSLRVNDKEIVFSRDAVELLGITEENKIQFVRSKKDKSDIYIYTSDKGYTAHKCGNRFKIFCRGLARSILISTEQTSAIYRLGEKEYINEEIMFPVITRINYKDEN